MKRACIAIAVLIVCALLSSPAAAGDAVLESYAGERPDDAAELLAPLHQELASRGYIVGKPLVQAIETRVSRSGRRVSAADLSDAKAKLDSADEAFVRGQWKKAYLAAEQGIEILMRSPAGLAGNEDLRRQYRHGLIIVAESHRRLGNAKEATAAMAEMIRAFPMNDISSAQYSPAVTRFFNQTRSDLEQQDKGKLEVRVDDPAVMVFINGRYVGAGRVSLDVIPGSYRVLTRKGAVDGRLRIANVGAGGDASLNISWPLDAALTTRGDYAGLEHESAEIRTTNEARNAIMVARHVDADGVVVIGIREHDGRRSIIGRVLSLDSGKPLRTGTLAIEPVEPRTETVRNLARYLAGEEVEGFEVAPLEDGGIDLATEDRSSWTRDPLGWSLTGAGVVGAVVGFGLLANASSLESDSNDEPLSSRRRALRDDAERRRLGGAIAAAAGGTLLVGGIITLAINPRHERESMSMWFHAGARSVAIGGSF